MTEVCMPLFGGTHAGLGGVWGGGIWGLMLRVWGSKSDAEDV